MGRLAEVHISFEFLARWRSSTSVSVQTESFRWCGHGPEPYAEPNWTIPERVLFQTLWLGDCPSRHCHFSVPSESFVAFMLSTALERTSMSVPIDCHLSPNIGTYTVTR